MLEITRGSTGLHSVKKSHFEKGYEPVTGQTTECTNTWICIVIILKLLDTIIPPNCLLWASEVSSSQVTFTFHLTTVLEKFNKLGLLSLKGLKTVTVRRRHSSVLSYTPWNSKVCIMEDT